MKKIKKRFRKILGLNNDKLAWTKNLLAAETQKYGYEIGDYSYGKPAVLWWSKNSFLKIGKFCSFAEGVTIYLGGNHHLDYVTTYPFAVLRKVWGIKKGDYNEVPPTKGGVEIGSDVWVADNATILSGVKIGHGAVIANSAVVTKDVPPYAVVAGNPAKLVKMRFDDNTISKLLESQWWDLEESNLKKLLPYLLSTDINAFIEKCKAFKMPLIRNKKTGRPS